MKFSKDVGYIAIKYADAYSTITNLIKVIFLMNRRSEMTRDEFVRYYLEKHVPISKQLPGLRKYVVNGAFVRPGKEPTFDGASELWFDTLDAYRQAFSSLQGKLTSEDADKFIGKTTSLIVEEHVII